MRSSMSRVPDGVALAPWDWLLFSILYSQSIHPSISLPFLFETQRTKQTVTNDTYKLVSALAYHYWLTTTGLLLLAYHYWLITTGLPLLAYHYWLITTGLLLLAYYYWLTTTDTVNKTSYDSNNNAPSKDELDKKSKDERDKEKNNERDKETKG